MSDSSLVNSESLLRHEAFVLALARHLVGNDAEAEDVAQETLIAAWRRGAGLSSPRAWLAGVVRKRALNAARSKRRRSEHERAGAVHEAQHERESPREALELQQTIVEAVLALDEPYRAVVIAIYYEGRRPEQIARESGVTASTVRSRLARAHEQLRGKLDRKHGSRDRWFGGLGAWVLRREEVSMVSTSVVGWTLVGAAALATVVLIVLSQRQERAIEPVAAAPIERASVALEGLEAISSESNAPADRVAAKEPSPEPVDVEPRAVVAQDELDSMVTRMRQIKGVLIARATTPDPDIVREYEWLTALPDSGVTRIAARERFGFETDLPWLDGGGAYWSFTRRSHDYQSDPQIEFQSGLLTSGYAGRDSGLVHPFGLRVSLADLARGPERVERGLEDADQRAWSVLWRELGSNVNDESSTLADDYRKLNAESSAFARVGECYLLRAVSTSEYDIVVALEVAALDAQSVTIAWRMLRSLAVSNPRPPYRHKTTADSLPTPPDDILTANDEALTLELAQLRKRGELMLFDAFPPPYDELARQLRDRRDAGLVRLVERDSPWSEFSLVREGGAYFSFVTESHSFDREPDISLEAGRLGSAYTGWFLSLGDVELDSVARWAPPPSLADEWTFLWEFDPSQLDFEQRYSEMTRTKEKARALGFDDYPIAVVPNVTFLLCSVVDPGHVVLAACRVHARDKYGVILEWRRLRVTPLTR